MSSKTVGSIGALVACALLWAGAAPSLARDRLELVKRFDLPAEVLSPLDVRFSERGTLFISTLDGRVLELDLRPGLPIRETWLRSEREAAERGGKRNTPMHLATSGSWLLYSNSGSVRSWWRLGSAASGTPVRTARSGLGLTHDIDLRGEAVALLGIPDGELWERERKPFLWLSDLGSAIAEWDPTDLREAGTNPSGARVFRHHGEAATGSVRFLAKGDLVVALPALGVFRVSGSGKVLEHHELKELVRAARGSEPAPPDGGGGSEAVQDDASFDLPEEGGAEPRAEALSGLTLVDEVLPLGRSGALVLRERTRGGFGWSILTLTDPPRRLEVPARGGSSGVRVRGDVDSKGRIALLLAARPRGDWLAPEERGGEVLLLTLSEE